MPTVILIAGVPATGKSRYSAWLEKEKGLVHLDFDELLQGNGEGQKFSLVEILRQRGVEAFISAPELAGRSVVIDWGFPVQSLPAVRALQAAGVEMWWFHGRRQTARQKFTERGGMNPRDFDVQMDAIEANWDEITRVFGSRSIETLLPDGTYMPQEEIFRLMLCSREEQPHP